MPPPVPGSSPLALALAVIAGLAACAIAAAVMVPTMLGGVGPWPVLIVGAVVLVVSLTALFVLHRRRDRTMW